MSVWQQISGHIATSPAVYVLSAVVVAVLSAGVALGLFMRVRSLTRPLARIREGGEDAAQLVAGIATSIEGVEQVLERVGGELRAHVEESRAFVRHIGLVRFDAFAEVGANQSFSLCLLDGDRNGVILTYLTGKNFTRAYAVTVADGKPSRELGDEETRAMEEALAVEPALSV